ncbi:MAG: sodium/proton-translocating pyrophosphatase, partial [Candidatus Krumholzibacteria bacterium]|nr:sodium/proton-translocating pyrophosphatase [Candidatus Krumholzibacteria bacterium]
MSNEILTMLLNITPWIGVAGMVLAVLTYFNIKRYPDGSEVMKKISDKIHHGAFVFLKREYSIILIFIVVVFAVLTFALNVFTAIAFTVGAFCSMGAGLLGMEASTRSSVRACQGAKDGGIGKALMIAFRGGSVMGISVAALGVVG